jgi:hypothetical protein
MLTSLAHEVPTPLSLLLNPGVSDLFRPIGAPDPGALLQAQVEILGARILIYLIEVDSTGAGWQTFNPASTFDDEEYSHLLELLGDDEDFETINFNGRNYILLAVPAQGQERS